MKEGISGILRPNGEFIPCEYGKHHTIADCICKEEEFNCITFSSSMRVWGNDANSAIHWDKDIGITKKQYNWLMEHKDEFDNMQYRWFIEPLVKHGEEWIKIID